MKLDAVLEGLRMRGWQVERAGSRIRLEGSYLATAEQVKRLYASGVKAVEAVFVLARGKRCPHGVPGGKHVVATVSYDRFRFHIVRAAVMQVTAPLYTKATVRFAKKVAAALARQVGGVFEQSPKSPDSFYVITEQVVYRFSLHPHPEWAFTGYLGPTAVMTFQSETVKHDWAVEAWNRYAEKKFGNAEPNRGFQRL
jgi:hypothetical protein